MSLQNMPPLATSRAIKTGSWTAAEDKLLAELQARVGNR